MKKKSFFEFLEDPNAAEDPGTESKKEQAPDAPELSKIERYAVSCGFITEEELAKGHSSNRNGERENTRRRNREEEAKNPLLWYLKTMESILRYADDCTAAVVRGGMVKYITTSNEDTKADIYRNCAKANKNARALFIALWTLYHNMEAGRNNE